MGLEPISNIVTMAPPITKPAAPPKAVEKSEPTAPENKASENKASENKASENKASENKQVVSANETAPVITKSEAKDQKNEQGSSNDQEKEYNTAENLKKAIETINKNVSYSEAIFGIHEKTNRVTIKIIDRDTKELIKELPPEKTLDMIAKAWELAGLLVDEKL